MFVNEPGRIPACNIHKAITEHNKVWQVGLRYYFPDDDLDDKEMLQKGLHEMAPEHTLHNTTYGKQLLAAVKEFKPDLIILDYKHARLNGAECFIYPYPLKNYPLTP